MRRITRLRKASGLLNSSSISRSTNCPHRLHAACWRHEFSTGLSAPILSSQQRRNSLQWGRAYSTLRPDEQKTQTQEDKEAQPVKQETQLEAAEESQSSLSEREIDPFELEEEFNDVEEVIETDIILPPRLETAARENEVDDHTYVPAESGDDLEEVGGLQEYWDSDENWTSSKVPSQFGLVGKVQDAAVLEVMARRAVVEALAVRDHGETGDVKLRMTDYWAHGGEGAQTVALGSEIVLAEDGSAALQGDAAGLVSSLAQDPSFEVSGFSTEAMDAAEARELAGSWDPSWKTLSLADASFKFAVTKRIFQLTGHLIPDAQLLFIHNVRSLLATLVKPPKPKKLAEEIKSKGELEQLPNVTVYNRRVTPIDKEKMVGRWKVIVQELEKRELPVTGTGGHGKFVEMAWARGGEVEHMKYKKEKKDAKLLARRNNKSLRSQL